MSRKHKNQLETKAANSRMSLVPANVDVMSYGEISYVESWASMSATGLWRA